MCSLLFAIESLCITFYLIIENPFSFKKNNILLNSLSYDKADFLSDLTASKVLHLYRTHHTNIIPPGYVETGRLLTTAWADWRIGNAAVFEGNASPEGRVVHVVGQKVQWEYSGQRRSCRNQRSRWLQAEYVTVFLQNS